MRRWHLFELADQHLVPACLRRYIHELLQYQVGSIYQPLLPRLQTWLNQLNQPPVVYDLASGAGGPWPALLNELEWSGDVILSDNVLTNMPYAQDDQKKSHESARINWHTPPVDLREPKSWPTAPLTLFTALHHLKPDQVHNFLTQIANNKQPIFIAEFTERKLSKLLGMLPSPLLVWLQTPAIRPFSWGRLLFTYIIPLVPLIYLWDGCVSHLRSYSGDELAEFARVASREGYSFETFDLKDKKTGINLTGLVGFLEKNE